MKPDLLMIIIGVLIVAAMILTLIYGKQFSRHGFGDSQPPTINYHYLC